MRIEILDECEFLKQAESIHLWRQFRELLRSKKQFLLHCVDFKEDIDSKIEQESYFGFLAEYIFTCFWSFLNDMCDEVADSYTPPNYQKLALFIELIFVDSLSIRTLNREYLGRDYSTDVLSFPLEVLHCNPYEMLKAANSMQRKSNFYHFIENSKSNNIEYCLGSIVVNKDEALIQAKRLKHGLYVEISLLFIHACLHLLGFNHESDYGEQRILEKEIIESLGLSHGLIERAYL